MVFALVATSACSGDEEFILVYSLPPPAQVVAGDLWPEIHVQLADLRGDGQNTSGIAITMILTEGDSQLLGTVTRQTSAGIAVFDDISYTLAQNIEITFVAAGYRSSQTRTITVVPNVPDHPRIVGEVLLDGSIDETLPPNALFDDVLGNSVPIPAGQVWPDFMVQIEDAFGNVVETSRDITLAVTDGSGTVQSQNMLFTGRTFLGRYVFDSRNGIFSTSAGALHVTVLSGNLDPAFARLVDIIPDVPADLSFEMQPQNVSTDDRQTVTVAVRDQYQNIIRAPYTGNTLLVAIRIDVDASALSDAFLRVPNAMTMMLDPLPQISINAINGIATFELNRAVQIDRPGLGFRLGAFAPSLPSASTTLDLSDSFDVEAGDPDFLSFVHPPAVAQVAGRRWNSTDINPMTSNPFPVVVRVNDQFGNLTTNDFTTIVRVVASNNNPVNGGFAFNQRTAAGGIVDFGIDILQNLTYFTAEVGIDVTAEAVPFSALVPVPDPVDAPNPITIVNNDAASQAFVLQPRSDAGPIVMGDPTNTSTDTQQTVTVSVHDAYGNLFVQDPDTMAQATVTLRIPAAFNVGSALLVRNDNPATLDTSIAVVAMGGTATFAGTSAIQLSKKGIGYRLQADSTALPSVQSNFFDIVHGAPASLNFIDEPESTHADNRQQVQAEVLDRFGNRATSAESPLRTVELVLQNAPGAAMQGQTSTNPINGIATFSDFQVDLVGTNYNILVRSLVPTTLLTDTSAPFNISNGLPVRVAFTGQPAAVSPPARVGEDISVQITYFDQFDNVAMFRLDGINPLEERAALLLVNAPPTGLCISGCEAAGTDDALPNGVIDYLIQVDRPTDGIMASGDEYRFRILPSNPLIFPDTNSNGIDVAVGAPDHLAYIVAPRTFETAGIPWAPFIVEVQDIFDNRVTNANGLLTITETGAALFDPTIATLSDTLVGGRAIFNSIRHITAEPVTFVVQALAGVTVGATPFTPDDTPELTVTVEPDVPDNLTFENFGPAVDDTNATTIAATSQVAGVNWWPDFEVAIRDAFGNIVNTNQVVTVSIDPSTGTGTLQGTRSVSAESGVARFVAGNPFFDATVETPGLRLTYNIAERIRLFANAGSVTQLSPSPEINVIPAAPHHMRFLDDPVDGTTDDAQVIRVQQEDVFNNRVYNVATLPDQQRNITLEVRDNAMMSIAAVITPSDTVNTGSVLPEGISEFNVQVPIPGLDYTLRASTGGITMPTLDNLNSFDILNGGLAGLLVTTQPMVTASTVDDTFSVTVELQDQFGNRLCNNPNGTLLVTGPALELRLVQSPVGAQCLTGCGLSTSLGSATFSPGTMACNAGAAAWTFNGITVDLPNDAIPANGDEYRWEIRELSGTPNVLTNALPTLNAGTPVAFEIVTGTDAVEVAGEVWAPLTVRLVDQRGNPSGSDNIELVPTSATGPLPGGLYPPHIGNPPMPPLQPLQGSTVVNSTAVMPNTEATFNDIFATRAESMTFEVRAQTLGTVAPLPINIRIDAAQLDHLTFINAAFGVIQEAGVPFVDAGAMPASFVVDLRDAFNNRVISNRAINLVLTSGNTAAFNAANPGLLSVTANNGVATFPGVSHTAKQTIVVGATAGPVLSTTISNNAVPVEAAGPNNMFVSVAPTTPITADQIDAGAQVVTLHLRDAFNNIVDGDQQGGAPAADDGAVQLLVPPSVDSPYMTNFVSGIANFTITDTTAGTFATNTATTAIPGVTNSPLAVPAFTVRNGVYSQIAITSQPAAGLFSLDTTFDISFQIQDAFGNPITTGPSLFSPVALVLDSYADSYGSFSPGDAGCYEVDGNPCTDLINAGPGGNVTFANVLVNRTGDYRFRGENASGTIMSAASNQVQRNVVGAPAELVFVESPDPTVTAGELWDPITLEIQDQFGNPAEVAHMIELDFVVGTLTNGTLILPTSAITSQVTFNDLYAETSGDYEFDVLDNTSVGVNGPAGVEVEVRHAEPDHLTFTNANLTPTFTAGADFATIIAEPGVQVQVRDAFENPIPTSRSISLVVNSGTDTLRLFSNTAMNVGPQFANPTIGFDGTATFGDITYLTAESVSVGAVSGPLISNNSYDMTINPGVQAQLAISRVERLDPMTFAATNIADLANVTASLGRDLNVDDQLRVTAQIRDAFGNRVGVAQDEDVTLSVGDDDGGGPVVVIAGGALQPTVNGQVIYIVTIQTAGDNYFLGLDDLGGAIDLTAIRNPAGMGNNFDVNAGALNNLNITAFTPPATVDGTVSVTTQLRDQFNNLISSGPSLNAPLQAAISVANPGPAGATCVAGCGMDFTDAGGVVTMNTIQLDRSGAALYGLRIFNPASGIQALTATFALADGAATQLAFVQQPDAVQTAGTDFNTFTVAVQDQFGNLIEADAGRTITLAPTVGVLLGDLNDDTVAGIATFADVSADTPGNITFHGEDGVLAATADLTVRIEPGQPHHLEIISSPVVTQTAGANWTQDVVVEVRDAFDNVVQTSIPVTLRRAAGDGTLSGVTTVNALGGVATFPMGTVSYDRVGQGQLPPLSALDPEFDAFTGPVGSTTTFAVNMTADVAETLAYVTQPQDVTQNESQQVLAAIVDVYGNIVVGNANTIDLNEISIPAVSESELSSAVTGIATFTFSVAPAGTFALELSCSGGVDCNATVMGNAPIISSPFTVSQGSMDFIDDPRSIELTGANWTSDGADPITVGLLDGNGEVNPAESDTLTARLGSVDEGVLYVISGIAGSNRLQIIDLNTTSTVVAPNLVGFNDVVSIAWDRNAGALFGVTDSNELITLDRDPDSPTFGVGTLVAALPAGRALRAIEYVDVDGAMYGLTTTADAVQANNLVIVNTATAVITDLPGGALPAGLEGGLAYRADLDQLLHLNGDGAAQVLRVVSRTTGSEVPGSTVMFTNGSNANVLDATFYEDTMLILRATSVGGVGAAPQISDLDPDTGVIRGNIAQNLGAGATIPADNSDAMAWAHVPFGYPLEFPGGPFAVDTDDVLSGDSDGNGVAGFDSLSYPLVGTVKLDIFSSGHGNVLFTPVNVVTNTPTHLTFVQDPGVPALPLQWPSDPLGAGMPPFIAGAAFTTFAVEVRDENENVVDVDGVTIMVNGDGLETVGGFAGGQTAATVDGVATFTVTSYLTAETFDMGASALVTGLSLVDDATVLVTIDPDSAGGLSLAFATAPTSPVTAGATWADFSVEVVDAFGNRDLTDTGSTITMALGAVGIDVLNNTSLTAMTNMGLATFTAAGNAISYNTAEAITLDVDHPGAVTDIDEFAMSVTPAAVDHLTIVGLMSPQTAGTVWAPAFTVEVRDVLNNVVTGVTPSLITLTSDGAVFDAGNTAVTSSGVASFAAALMDTAGAINVSATATINGLPYSAATVAVTVDPDPAAPTLQLVDAASNPLTVEDFAAGEIWPDFQIEAVDADGNVVTGVDGTITITLATGDGSLANSLDLTATMVAGVATFTAVGDGIHYTANDNPTIDIDYNDDGTAPFDGTNTVAGIAGQAVMSEADALEFQDDARSAETAGAAWTSNGADPITVQISRDGGVEATATDTVGLSFAQQHTNFAANTVPGVLYGTDGGTLYEVDPVTGGGNLIGAHGGDSVFSMAVNPVDGVLYGVNDGTTNCGGTTMELVTIDRGTGAQASVACTGLPPPGPGAVGLAFDSAGTLYLNDPLLAGMLFTVDTVTAAPTPVAMSDAAFGLLTYREADDELYSVNNAGTGLAVFGGGALTDLNIAISGFTGNPLSAVNVMDTIYFVDDNGRFSSLTGPSSTITDISGTTMLTLAWAHAEVGAEFAVNGTTTQTAVAGVATFDDLNITLSGDYFIGFGSDDIATTRIAPQALRINPAAPFMLDGMGSTIAATTAAGMDIGNVTITVQDQYGNIVTSAAQDITLSIGNDASALGNATLTGGGAMTPVAGSVNYAPLMIDKAGVGYTFAAGYPGVPTVFSPPFDIEDDGTVTDYEVVLGAAVVTAGIPVDVTVNALDTNGNLVDTAADDIFLTVSTNGSVSPVVTTMIGMLAAGTLTTQLTFTSAGVNDTIEVGDMAVLPTITGTSGMFDVIASSADALVYTTAPAGPRNVDDAPWPLIEMEVQDAFGNKVNENGRMVSLELVDGTGGFGGTTTQATLAGVASFNDLTYLTAETIEIDFSSGALARPGQTTIVVNTGAAAQLAFGIEPPAMTQVDTPMAYFTVEVHDQGGNLVTAGGPYTIDLTLTPLTGAGTLGGVLSAVTDSGIAVFHEVTYDTADAFSIDADEAGVPLTGTTSALVTAALAPAAPTDAELASEDAANPGETGNGYSSSSGVSGDGRFVCFQTDAGNLVVGDYSSGGQIVVRDRASGTNELASERADGVNGNGPSYWCSISADGRYVVFDTLATNFAPALETAGNYRDVFVKDRLTGDLELISINAAGDRVASGDSTVPAISPDGRFVAFQSDAADLIAGDTNGVYDIFLRDRFLQTTTRVSVDESGAQLGAASLGADVSHGGRYVVFYTAAAAAAIDTNGNSDVYRWSAATGTSELVSHNPAGTGAGNGDSFGPRISWDGSIVAYYSAATDLTGADANGGLNDIILWDAAGASNTIVSLGILGNQVGSPAIIPDISGDGTVVCFWTVGDFLNSGDTNGVYDIYARDIGAGTTSRVSVALGGGELNGDSYSCAISRDGAVVGYHTSATNHGFVDANGANHDVIVGTK